MENENIVNGGNNGVPPAPQNLQNPESVPNGDNKQGERLYSKSEITTMMKSRVDRSHKAFFDRYGVADLKGLDELFDRTKQLTKIQEEIGALTIKNAELARENAFLRNDINPEKYEDIIAHFKGNNVDFSEDKLIEFMANHPEWAKQKTVQPTTTIKQMGKEQSTGKSNDELALAKRLLNF